MKYFGYYLKDCRTSLKPKVTQRQIADLFPKDPSVISKWESENESQRREVGFPTPLEKGILVDFFRKQRVSEDKIANLDLSWKEEFKQGLNLIELPEDELFAADLMKTIQGLPQQLAISVKQNITSIVHISDRFAQTVRQFDQGKLPFVWAEEVYSELLEESDHVFELEMAQFYLKRAMMRRFMGNIKDALSDFDDSYAILKRQPDPNADLLRTLLIEYADCLSRINATHYPQALEFYNEVQKFNPKDPRMERRIARIYIFSGNPEAALKHCQASLDIAVRNGKKEDERKALEHIAWALSLLGRLDQALAIQINALSMAEKMDHTDKELAKSHRYLGDYYLLCGDLKSAEENFRRASQYISSSRSKMKDGEVEEEKLLRGPLLLGLATAYLSDPQKISEAERLLGISIDISKELEDISTYGIAQMRLGQIYLEKGRLDLADEQFQAAEKKFEQSGLTAIGDKQFCNPYLIAELDLQKAKLQVALNHSEKALDYYKEAEDLAENFGYGRILIDTLIGQELVRTHLASQSYSDFVHAFELILERADAISPCLAGGVVDHIHVELDSIAKRDKERITLLAKKILKEWPKKSWGEQFNSASSDNVNSLMQYLRQMIPIWEKTYKEMTRI